jgi:hypothetical protein
MSTPIQESKAQLSGPPIPGVQIREDGKLDLIVNRAFSNKPGLFDNWGESVKTITDGCSPVVRSEGSWCNEFQVTGTNSIPEPNSPEFDSTRLGGSTNPWVDSQVSRESNGKQRLARVDTFIFDGIEELSMVE